MTGTVKNPSAVQETWVWSLGWEDPLEEAWQPSSVFLPGEFPWTEERQSMGLERVRHDWAAKHSASSISNKGFPGAMPQRSNGAEKVRVTHVLLARGICLGGHLTGWGVPEWESGRPRSPAWLDWQWTVFKGLSSESLVSTAYVRSNLGSCWRPGHALGTGRAWRPVPSCHRSKNVNLPHKCFWEWYSYVPPGERECWVPWQSRLCAPGMGITSLPPNLSASAFCLPLATISQ